MKPLEESANKKTSTPILYVCPSQTEKGQASFSFCCHRSLIYSKHSSWMVLCLAGSTHLIKKQNNLPWSSPLPPGKSSDLVIINAGNGTEWIWFSLQ